MGEWPVTDASNNTYQAYRDHFKWEIGMVGRDWRYAVRIANIDVTQLTGVSAANLINLIVRGLYRMPLLPLWLPPSKPRTLRKSEPIWAVSSSTATA